MSKQFKATALLLVFSMVLFVIPNGLIDTEGRLAASAYTAISQETEQKFIDRMKSAIENLKDSIDISDLSIPKTYDFTDVFYGFCEDHPEYFYLSTGYSASYRSNYFRTFSLNFTNKVEDIVEMRKAFDKASKEALSGVDNSWPDLMKALYLHDYLVLHAEYDADFDEWNTDFDDMCYTAYGILVDKIGVCQGYSYAYSYLLNSVGIDNKIISSEDMCHVWNLVRIDGEYYHVDVTFDDTECNNIGRAKHNNFMLSDNKIVNASGTKHHGWQDSTDICANSTKYDNYFWRSIESGFFPINNKWYFTEKNGNINSYNPATSAVSTLMNVDVNWKRWGASDYLKDKYVRLIALSDRIIYNTDREIYMTDINTISPEKIFEADVSSGYIYGIGLENDTVTYCLKTRSGETEKVYNTDITVESLDVDTGAQRNTEKTVNYFGYGGALLESQLIKSDDLPTAPKMGDVNGYRFINWTSKESDTEIDFYAVYKLIGDMNDDGVINLLDAYKIYCLYKNGTNITTDEYKLGDINGDSQLNIADCTLMLYNFTHG